MRLTGPEFTELEDALRDAYVDYDDLGVMLRRAGWRIEDITSPAPLPAVVSAVIADAEARDSVHELVSAARASKPENVKLLRVAAAIGLEPGGVPREEIREDEALARVSDHFERMVDPNRGIADLGSFAARLQELLQQVCAVELGDGAGTGFLIGPETILTNYHVVEKAIKKRFDPAQVRVRFDFRRLRDRLTTNAGTVYELADDWLVHAEPYSPVDAKPYDEGRVPAENELDYAVLRTRVKVGLESPTGPVEVPRGSDYSRVDHLRLPDRFVLDGRSAPLSRPHLIRRRRRRCRARQLEQNSGALPHEHDAGVLRIPVLSRKLDLVALHHAGEPGGPDFGLPCHKQVTQAAYNEGIPIDGIQRSIDAQGLSWVFGAEAP